MGYYQAYEHVHHRIPRKKGKRQKKNIPKYDETLNIHIQEAHQLSAEYQTGSH